MEDISVFILLGGIVGIGGIFVYYIFKTYVKPKKIEELAEMVQKGQLAPAIKKLQSLLEQNDRDPFIHYLLAEAYYKQNNLQQAVLEYKQVIKIGKFTSRLKEETIRSRLAGIYMANKNLEEAKKEYLILTKLDPTNGDHFYKVGKLFDDAGMFDKALPYYKQSVKIDPKNANALIQLGIIEYNTGNINDARKDLGDGLTLDPKNFKAHYYMGLTLKSQKDYESALKELEIAIKDDSIRASGYLARGMCFLERDMYQKSKVEFERGLGFATKSSEVELKLRYFLSIAAENMRDFHTAISNWERIMDINPKYKDVAQKLKDYEEFRTDDSIKDFMIASPGKFEAIARQIIEALELTIIDINMVNDSAIHALATETLESKGRSTKRMNQLVYLYRLTDPVPERMVRQMHEDMKSKGASKGFFLVASQFTKTAQMYCESRPIELVDRGGLIKLLRGISNV